MMRQPTFEYTASPAPTFGGNACVRGTVVSAVLMAVSVDAMVFAAGRPFSKADGGLPCGKNDFDLRSLTECPPSWSCRGGSLHPESQRTGAVIRRSLGEVLVVSTCQLRAEANSFLMAGTTSGDHARPAEHDRHAGGTNSTR